MIEFIMLKISGVTMENLRTNVQPYFQDGDHGISVYAVLKSDASIRKLDISNEALPGLMDVFLGEIERSIVNKEDAKVLNLSSSDERVNAIYKYDLDLPDELNVLNDVLASDDHEVFSFTSDELNQIRAFIVEIGNDESQIVLYKTLASVNVFGRSSFFLKKSDRRFEQLEDEFLRISPSFQMIFVDGELYVMDLTTLEKFFGFHDVIKKEALASVEKIEELSILENPDVLGELVEDVSFARKLTKVAKASPVISSGVSTDRIIEFCRNHPELKKIRINGDGTKMFLDTKVSKNLFVKLLMDDYLNSELTEYEYVSVAKDALEP